MASYDVFLCHNSKEKPAIREINQVLRQQFELRTFMDESDLVGGEIWEENIRTAMHGSKTCAVMLGGLGWGLYQLEGELVPALARRAIDTTFHVIPVLMPGFDEKLLVVRRDVEDLFAKTMWVDLRNGVDDISMKLLAASIRGENAFPEGRPQLTAARVRFDAIRWSVTRNDPSLLYQGGLLEEATTLMVSRPGDAAPALEFLAAAHRYQDELIGRRLAAHAGALIGDWEKTDLAVALADEATRRHSTPGAIDVLRNAITKLARTVASLELPSAVTRVAVGPRDIVIGCAEGQVVAWDQQASTVLPKAHAGGVTSLTFDAQQRWFASGGEDGLIHIWDVATREWMRTLTLGDPVMRLHARTGPGGDYLLADSAGVMGAGDGGHVKLWNVAEGWTDSWRWVANTTQGAVIAADARVVLLAWGDHLAVAAVDTGALMGTLGVDQHVFAIDAHPIKPGLALTTGDGTLWLGTLSNEGGQLDPVAKDISQAGALRFSPRGRWLAALGRDKLRVWDMERGGEPLLLPYEGLFAIDASFSPDETLVVVRSGETGALTVWNLVTRAQVYATRRIVSSPASFLTDRRLVTTGAANTLEIIELPGTDPAAWTLNPYQARLMTFSPDERWLAWAGVRVVSGLMAADSLDRLFTVTDVASGEPLVSNELPARCEGIGFDPLSSTAVARSGGALRGFPLDGDQTREVVVDESWMAAAPDAAPASTLVAHPAVQQACASRGFAAAVASPSGRYLAVSHERHLTSLWDMTTGTEVFQLTASGEVHRCVFDRGETRVAFGDERGGIAIWATDGVELMTLQHADGILALTFSPRGTYLAASSVDGCLRLWVIDRGELVARVRRRTQRQMTDEDWSAYFPGLPREPRAAPSVPGSP